MPHVHVSALDALIVFAYLLILSALWRTAAAKLSKNGSPLGDAMGAIL